MKKISLACILLGTLLLVSGVCFAYDDFSQTMQELKNHENLMHNDMESNGIDVDVIHYVVQAQISQFIQTGSGYIHEVVYLNGSIEQQYWTEMYPESNPDRVLTLAVQYIPNPNPDTLDYFLSMEGIEIHFTNNLTFPEMQEMIRETYRNMGKGEIEDWTVSCILDTQLTLCRSQI